MRPLSALLLSLLLPAFAFAQEAPSGETNPPAAEEQRPADATPRASTVLFEELTIVGGPDAVHDVPGSAHYIDSEELERQDYTDIHRILRQVPGVNLQEEEGFGLRPNIGMRGTGVERSQKITLMEDGVLIAPAPYAAPAAYYFPTAGRMEAVEVRKGSTSIIQGPYTTGGAINMISTSVPYDLLARIDMSAGEYGTGRGHLAVGDSAERFGWLLETFQLRTDGFKKIDGGGDTGFDLSDYVGKIRFNSSPSSTSQHAFEVKLGYVTQDGDETYLGLTDADFGITPFRRYAGSRADTIETEHEQIQLRHFFSRSAAWDVTTTAYRNDFFRNWYKLGSVAGASIASILDDPSAHAVPLAILRGEVDDDQGALSIRANRRDYYAMGLQSIGTLRLDRGGVEHALEVGVRYHEDEEDRFQEDDRWGIRDGRMFLVSSGMPGSNANRVGSAEAVAVFVQDQIRVGRLTVTPGIRFESIDFSRLDYGRSDPDRTGSALNVRENSVEAWIPGIGASWEMSPEWLLFAGVHRGFAPPGPGADQRTEPEESVNYETGVRWSAERFSTQLVGFFNDYTNLLGRDTLSSGGGGAGDLFNGGEVEVKGIEASVESDLLRLVRGASDTLRVPVRFAYTWTEATFQTSFETGFADWGPAVTAGDRLPYLPEQQWSLGAGVDSSRWMAHATLSYTDEMLTEPAQGTIARASRTDDYLTLDLAGEVAVYRNLRATAQLRNATDETYIVARRPAGVRPGMPRTLLLGFRWTY